ncbi:MAG: PAS domain-containing sensor histidine kinase [Alphaproteobacteria bacterium]|nr:PAS domain-containing sensor histidine kinase [Alphaproteobacteria bacterium]
MQACLADLQPGTSRDHVWHWRPGDRPAGSLCRWAAARTGDGRPLLLVRLLNAGTSPQPGDGQDTQTLEARLAVELLQQIEHAVTLYDASGRELYRNTAGQRLALSEPGEWQEDFVAGFADPMEGQAIWSELQRVGHVSGEVRVRTARATAWHLLDGRAVRDPSSGAHAYLVEQRDLSTRRAIEEELRQTNAKLATTARRLIENEQRFRDFTEASVHWYWELDSELRFTFVSEGIERFLGHPKEQYLGHWRGEVPGISGLPEELQALNARGEAEVRRLRDQRKPFFGVRLARLHLDGTPRFVVASGKPHFGDDGAFLGYRGSSVDVTARVQAEDALRRQNSQLHLLGEALKEAERRFRDFTEASSHYFWESDPADRLTYVSDSAEAILGIPATQITGRPRGEATSLKWPDDPGLARIAEAVRRREPYMDVVRAYAHPTKGLRFISVSGRPYHDERGNFLGFRGTSRDVTDEVSRQRAMEELRVARDVADAANRAKSQFLANMSHELRTPLNAIIGFSEVMGEEMFGPVGNETYRGYVADIHRSARHLLAIISDILDMSRIEAGQYQIEDGEVALRSLLDEVIAMLAPLLRNADLALDASGAGSTLCVRADRRVLKQVLLNILSNCIKFTPAGGRIVLLARVTETGALRLWVSDTGEGIAPDRLPRLFEPFQQGDASQARRQGGAGLGLWISRGLMQAHGGDLWLESAPGHGTTAHLVLPADRVLPPAA